MLLTIQAGKALEAGVQFLSFGESLYLANSIPPDCFTGPPLPKAPEKEKRPVDPLDDYIRKARAGTFPMAAGKLHGGKPTDKPHKGEDWKTNKKRLRREKKHFWPDE